MKKEDNWIVDTCLSRTKSLLNYSRMLKKKKQRNRDLRSKCSRKEGHRSQESQPSKIKYSHPLFRLDQVRI